MTSTRIKRMKLKSPYAAVVATKEGIEAKVSHSGFSLFYANTWEGIRRDCNLLAEKIRRPHGEPPDEIPDAQQGSLRLVSAKE